MLCRKTPTRCLFPMIKIQCVAHQLQVPKQFPKTQIDTEKSLQITLFSRSVISDSDPMDCSTPGLPVHHQFPEFTQTHVHQGSDAINHLILCRPLLPLQSFPASGPFQMSQFFASGGQTIRVSASASVRPVKFRTDFL